MSNTNIPEILRQAAVHVRNATFLDAAAECMRAAINTDDEKLKQAYLEMAKRLADRVEL